MQKESAMLRKQFLSEKADFLAQQLRTTEEKALRAIMKAKESRWIYSNLKEIMGKQRSMFTQVDVHNDSLNPDAGQATLSSKIEIEEKILERNRRHSLQSLSTPFFSIPTLQSSIDPHSKADGLDKLLNGSIMDFCLDSLNISDDEINWIYELQRIVGTDILLDLTIEDFKYFFHSKQEKTASSPSGQHMGHYKTMLNCIQTDNPMIPNLIVNIAYISLVTGSSLSRWKTACQVMLEKGKGRFIENLHIIQLCDFMLHTKWGYCLICHAS